MLIILCENMYVLFVSCWLWESICCLVNNSLTVYITVVVVIAHVIVYVITSVIITIFDINLLISIIIL